MDNLDYGVIGNCTSAALISKTGSIDWCCLPEFNSGSVFAKILDEDKGGEFSFEVDDTYTISQKYHDNTNILITRFEHDNDIFEVVDFMPRYPSESGHEYAPPDIIRYINHISGAPKVKIIYNPQLNYAEFETATILQNEYIKSYAVDGPYESIYLYTDLPHQQVMEGAEITIDKDYFLLLSYNEKLILPTLDRANLKLQRTEVYWLNWVERGVGFSKHRPEVVRSALVLRLLTYTKSGAVLAAITTSLPESIGEVRNWDYRFCWVRDASMMVRVLSRLGYLDEAQRFLDFILDAVPTKDSELQIMYGIRGEKVLTEKVLEHLAGYKNSRPVRIGNAAYIQKQHDIVGVLMDVIYRSFQIFKFSLDRSEEIWTIVRSILKNVGQSWQNPDKGIWEIRTEDRHFVFSKALAWVAADRGVKIARLLKKEHYATEWEELRDEIKENIMKFGWSEKRQAFTQSYGSDAMDASNLLLETYGFIEASDPRFISTVKAIKEELMHDGLMYRYINKDDFGLPSSSFTICTFWMIQSLFRIGEKDEARQMFEQVLSYSNHLGLFSEDIDFKTKRLLGNFPQGYSHLALIEAALLLDDNGDASQGYLLPFILSHM